MVGNIGLGNWKKVGEKEENCRERNEENQCSMKSDKATVFPIHTIDKPTNDAQEERHLHLAYLRQCVSGQYAYIPFKSARECVYLGRTPKDNRTFGALKRSIA